MGNENVGTDVPPTTAECAGSGFLQRRFGLRLRIR
ncbi:hypothetical protein [Lysobacter enzymogenes]